MEIKCIGLKDKIPKGWKYLSSWECEELLCNDFEIFKDLDLSVEVGYYELRNKKNNRYLWLLRLDDYSDINGDNWLLDFNNRVRGVLIWKQKP